MSQHDMNLANAAGAAFRSDLNDALGALVTNFSGASAPSTTFAYMWWADTTNGLLKIRNAANSNWVTVGTLASTNFGLLPLAGGTMTGTLVGTEIQTDSFVVNTSMIFNTSVLTGSVLDTSPRWNLIDVASGESYVLHCKDASVDGSYNYYLMRKNATTGGYAAFLYGTSTVGSITTNGTSTAYNTTSDERLKRNKRPVAKTRGNVVDQIEIEEFEWLHGGATAISAIAQKLALIVPEAVTPGSPANVAADDPTFRPWMIDWTKVIPYLILKLQDIEARLPGRP